MSCILATTPTFGREDPKVLEPLAEARLKLVGNPYGRALLENEIFDLISKYRPVGLLAGVEPLTERVLESALPELKVVSRLGVGWDNVNHEAAKRFGILVYRTPDAITDAVVELTVGLFLSLARKIVDQDRRIRQGIWKEEMGVLVSGKALGLFGYGRIGRGVARMMKSFGCRIQAYDPFVENWDEGVSRAKELESLFAESDLISIHAAFSPELKHRVGHDLLGRCRPQALLVNVSRGSILDEKALLEALQRGKLGGAALDVFEKEPYQGPLAQCDRVILTPHVGSYARESWIRMEREAVENLLKGLSEKRGIPWIQ